MQKSLTLLLFLIPFALLSQEFYSFDPTDSISVDVQPANNTVHYIYLNNDTNAELALSWRMVDYSLPDEWEFNLCDNAVCYSNPPPAFADFGPIEGDEQAFIKLTVNPNDILETGTVTFRIYPTGQPESFEIMFFEFKPLIQTSTKDIDKVDIQLFPNPATDYLQIHGVSNEFMANIFSLSGQKLMAVENKNQIDVSALSTGQYFIQISKGNWATTRIFTIAK